MQWVSGAARAAGRPLQEELGFTGVYNVLSLSNILETRTPYILQVSVINNFTEQASYDGFRCVALWGLKQFSSACFMGIEPRLQSLKALDQGDSLRHIF